MARCGSKRVVLKKSFFLVNSTESQSIALNAEAMRIDLRDFSTFSDGNTFDTTRKVGKYSTQWLEDRRFLKNRRDSTFCNTELHL